MKGGFSVFGKDPTYKRNSKSRFGKDAKTAAGRAMKASRARREAEAASEKALADKLAALLATAPKPEPAPKPAPVVEPEPPAPVVLPVASEPTPAELERARGEQLRLAQVAADMTVDVLMTWERIKSEGQRVRAAMGAGPDAVIEFTPTAGGRCATHDCALVYSTDWRAPECPVCRQQAEQQPKE